jgi:hypothetical protein
MPWLQVRHQRSTPPFDLARLGLPAKKPVTMPVRLPIAWSGSGCRPARATAGVHDDRAHGKTSRMDLHRPERIPRFGFAALATSAAARRVKALRFSRRAISGTGHAASFSASALAGNAAVEACRQRCLSSQGDLGGSRARSHVADQFSREDVSPFAGPMAIHSA